MTENNFSDSRKHERDLLIQEISKQQEELRSIEKAHQDNLKRLDLINQLIAIDEGETSKSFEESVKEILEIAARPMHIKEIYNELVDRKVPIPGKGSLENVVTRVSRAKDIFAREKSGTYTIKQRGQDTLETAAKVVSKGNAELSRIRNKFTKSPKTKD